MLLNKKDISALVLFSLPLLLWVSCATVEPPKELVTARAEYQKASIGPASKLNTAGLHEAKKSLDSANKAFEQDPKSDQTRDISYVAMRKVQLAEAQTKIELANQEKIKAGQDKQKTTEVALATTRTNLADSEEQRRHQTAKLSQSDEALQTSNRQLDAEKQARQNAERQAEEAIANLTKIALVKQEQRGLVITLSGSVLFSSGQSTLLPNARPKLDDVAQSLQRTTGNSFLVEGHTDSLGSESFNQDLSARRAQSVRDYLVERGVSSQRIKSAGYGKSRPVAENNTAEGRANNRRVEIVIQPPTS